jgi:hypothetical protein
LGVWEVPSALREYTGKPPVPAGPPLIVLKLFVYDPRPTWTTSAGFAPLGRTVFGAAPTRSGPTNVPAEPPSPATDEEEDWSGKDGPNASAAGPLCSVTVSVNSFTDPTPTPCT